MTAQLRLTEAGLKTAGFTLVAAARLMVENSGSLPTASLPSLTGIDGEVRRFLGGLDTGRRALGDAAKTAGNSVAEAMRNGSEVDRQIAAALAPGFAVSRGAS